MAQQDLAKAAAALHSVREHRLAAAIHIFGYDELVGERAFDAIIHYARRLGFAVANGRRINGHGADHDAGSGAGGGRSPLLDALALLIETRPEQRPLLIGVDRLDNRDQFTVRAIQFMAERLAREPVVWVVLERPGLKCASRPPQMVCGAPRTVFRQTLTPLPSQRVVEQDCPALTPAEYRVAQLVSDGFTNAAVARTLGVSASTVGTHLRAVFQKLQVRSRVQLANAMRVAS